MSEKEIIDRLKRIETKLVVFAEALGIDTDVSRDWLTVDEPHKVIYLSTKGRSLSVIASEAVRRGATAGGGYTYDLVHQGNVIGSVDL